MWQRWGRGSPCHHRGKKEEATAHHIVPIHTVLQDPQQSSASSPSNMTHGHKHTGVHLHTWTVRTFTNTFITRGLNMAHTHTHTIVPHLLQRTQMQPCPHTPSLTKPWICVRSPCTTQRTYFHILLSHIYWLISLSDA